MTQEFIATNGKVILENNVLYTRNLKFDFWNTLLGKLFFPVVVAIIVALRLMSAEKAFDYFLAIIWFLVFSRYYFSLIDIAFKRSFASRIPLNRIKTYELRPDDIGLETELKLHLKNGRYKSITFRTMEKQYEPLTEVLSQSVGQLQFA